MALQGEAMMRAAGQNVGSVNEEHVPATPSMMGGPVSGPIRRILWSIADRA
jgi:hypothetical protein